MARRLSVAEKRQRAEKRYPGILSLLGKETDEKVAIRYGLSGSHSIQRLRTSLEIPAYISSNNKIRKRHLESLAYVSAFHALCEKHPEAYEKLGIKSDPQIAAFYSVEILVISTARNLLEIPPYNAEKTKKSQNKTGPSALSNEEYREKIAENFPNIFSMFKQMSDRQVAICFRVTPQRIGQIRNRLRIPVYSGKPVIGITLSL